MYITITGELGSGKSTIANLLCDEYNFTKYSTGTIQREIAREKGITTLELNELMTKDLNNEYDKMIDDKTVEVSRNNIGKNIIFDSRMAWHFVDSSFKVYVTVDPYVAAKRVINTQRGEEEHYESIEEAVNKLKQRKQLEDIRFRELYSVNTTDFNNYDLVIDSSILTPQELTAFIIDKARNASNEKAIYISPQRLYPIELIKETNDISDNTPVNVITYNDFYYIVDDHNKVSQRIKQGDKLININIINIEDNNNIIDKIKNNTEDTYKVWEEYNNIKLIKYPNN